MSVCLKNISQILLCTILAALLLIGTASAAAPTAVFSGTPTSGTAPLTVQFTDTSAGSPTGWAWFFGDETYDQAWAQVNACPGWPARGSHTSVALPNGSIVLMGGYDDNFLNDTWLSADDGSTWTEVNASSGWTKRDDHTSVVMPDGSIVLMGGWGDLTCFNDTWLSTDGGGNWTCVNASSGWSGRFGHTSIAVGDSIVLMGGYDDDDNYLNDIWQSTDYGKTWEEVNPSAGWPARRSHTSVAMPDGSIVLMGGCNGTGDDYPYLNDTWRSTDSGEHWELVNASSGWSGRAYHTSVAMPDGSIVLMGGEGDDYSEYLNDIWRSTDGGATWTQLPDARWTGRSCHTSVAMPDGSIVLMGGEGYDYSEYLNDVWRLQPAGSTSQNPKHPYSAPGTYSVALQAFNADGYDLKTGYITVTAAPEPTPTRRPSSSGGGGGGSTGGPGGYNVGGDSAVARVTVTGTGTSGLIITGRMQSSPGAGIPPAPGIAYQYIDLVPARFENITGATITFTIPVAWLDEHGLSPEEIVMYHFNDNDTACEALPTTVERTGGGEATFTATSPGFSLFAISGIEQTGEAVTTPTTAQTTSPAVATPTAEQTTAVPAGEPAPEFPLGMIAIVAGAVLLLAAGSFLVRRWWIRRQNPALFRDYD